MKAATLLTIGLMLATQTALAKPDPANGASLFVNSPCNTPELTNNAAITNLAALDQSVRSCDIANYINWFEDEIRDVVVYLNQTYYKF